MFVSQETKCGKNSTSVNKNNQILKYHISSQAHPFATVLHKAFGIQSTEVQENPGAKDSMVFCLIGPGFLQPAGLLRWPGLSTFSHG